jgi:hypothetical protein
MVTHSREGKMKKEKEITMTFRLTASLHRALREYVNKRGLKIQNVTAEAIKEKINAKYEGA